MKKWILRIAIVLIGILAVALGRGFFFYEGFYSASPSEKPGYEQVIVPTAPMAEFADNYTQGKGIILIDLAHRNAFDKEELNVLMLRLVSRGLSVKFLTTEDDLKIELLGEEKEAEEKAEELEEAPLGDKKKLEEKSPPADAFIVISPQEEFSKNETDNVSEFVSRGGKLLLIADPTRWSEINNLSIQFGLIFESDYLYNMKENETNYRNIFVADFKENVITKGLKKIVLYTAGSISSADSSIAFVDENTFSNIIETRKRLSPIALAQGAKVLAIYDLTFMTEPNNGILDNNQLISNVADWLMAPGEKTKSK